MKDTKPSNDSVFRTFNTVDTDPNAVNPFASKDANSGCAQCAELREELLVAEEAMKMMYAWLSVYAPGPLEGYKNAARKHLLYSGKIGRSNVLWQHSD